jgi:endonuclease/exonuclease/phosphatase family metal-dependent hydrolase
MKIVQLNIWMGQLLHPALSFIDSETPDILCAQEVLSTKNGTGLFASYQTHERLSERFPYCFFAPTFSFESLGEVCKYGNAIYSKHPLSDMNAEFTVGAYQDNVSIGGLKEGGEIRNIQTCKVSPGGENPFYVANHHGYHYADSTGNGNSYSEASMRNVAAVLMKIEGPLVFCGDLNANPTSKTIHELDALSLRNLTVEYGLNNTLSKVHRFNHDLVVDYIFISQDFKPKSFRSSDDIVSDHKPLILESEF